MVAYYLLILSALPKSINQNMEILNSQPLSVIKAQKIVVRKQYISQLETAKRKENFTVFK